MVERAATIALSRLRTQLSMLRSFCTWALHEGHLTIDPPAGIAAPRVRLGPPRALRADEVARVLDHCPNIRARPIVLLMVQEGLRCCEVAGLDVDDIDTAARTLLVRHGKGGRYRWLPISDETWTAIEEYGLGRSGPLVRSLLDDRSRIGAHSTARRVAEIFTVAGLHRRAYDGRTAHARRHTTAVDLLRSGASVDQVRDFMGHSSIAVTDRYLRSTVRVDELRAASAGRMYAR